MATTHSETAHVPAWKRLGLKLKHAQDLPSLTIETPVQVSGESRKAEKRGLDVKDAHTTSKRHKPAPSKLDDASAPVSTLPTESSFFSGSETTKISGKPEPLSDNQALSAKSRHIVFEDNSTHHQPSPRRKSVSFSSDTKQDRDTSSKIRTKNASHTAAIDAPKDHPRQHRTKARQGSLTKKGRSADDTERKDVFENGTELEDADTPAYLQYLQEFHDDRNRWKFNKKKQNDLLKNVFNLRCIPSTHDSAILSYLKGLQGAARERLRQQAVKLVEEAGYGSRAELDNSSEDGLSDSKSEQPREEGPNTSEGANKRGLLQRANLILREGLGTSSELRDYAGPSGLAASDPSNQPSSMGRTSNRKSRTYIGSSSSESDSETEDSSSSEESKNTSSD